jgi:hypothetical protein
MKKLNFVLCLLTALLLSNISRAQSSYAVVYIMGDVKTNKVSDKNTNIRNLTYGNISLDSKLYLGKNSAVKLSKANGEKCELTKQGTYLVTNLIFAQVKEKSAMARFSEYFMSFFESHPSSESKAQYQNSIYAISRGGISTAVPEFPFEGKVPLMNNGLSFNWGIDCDTCKYELTIKDLATRNEVFKTECSNQNYTFDNSSQLLKDGNKYYWFVKVVGQNTISSNISFELVPYKEYAETVTEIENNFKKLQLDLPSEVKLASSIGELEYKDLSNFAYLYGKTCVANNPENKEVNKVFDQFYFDKMNKSEK